MELPHTCLQILGCAGESPGAIAVALEVTSAIPLQLHPPRSATVAAPRDAPAADRPLIDGESSSARRRSSSQGDDELPAPRTPSTSDTLHLQALLAVALSVRPGKVLPVGATGSTTIPAPARRDLLAAGPRGPYLAAGCLLGCAIMPAALTFVFLK